MAESTQVRYPGQTLLRSAVQALPVIVAAVVALIQEIGNQRPEWVADWLPFLISAQLILVRVMGNPVVNAFLEKFGLGTIPGKHSDGSGG